MASKISSSLIIFCFLLIMTLNFIPQSLASRILDDIPQNKRRLSDNNQDNGDINPPSGTVQNSPPASTTEIPVQNISNSGNGNQNVGNSGNADQHVVNSGKGNQTVNNSGTGVQDVNNSGNGNQNVTNTGNVDQDIVNSGNGNQTVSNSGIGVQTVSNSGNGNQSVVSTGNGNETVSCNVDQNGRETKVHSAVNISGNGNGVQTVKNTCGGYTQTNTNNQIITANNQITTPPLPESLYTPPFYTPPALPAFPFYIPPAFPSP